MTAGWRHDQLADDLAAHLRAGGGQMTWLNMSVGPAGTPRPDVFAMTPFAYASPGFVSYEVKVSIADFRSDVTAGKWQAYLSFSQGVTFAAPHGLLTAKDLPDARCGLILRSERGWRHVRRPTLGTVEITQAIWVKLLSVRPTRMPTYGGDPQQQQDRWLRDRAEAGIKAHARREIGKRYGEALARLLDAPDEAAKIIEEADERAAPVIANAERRAAEIKREAEDGWRELALTLGIDPATRRHEIATAIHRRAALVAEQGPAAEFLRLVDKMRRALEEAAALAAMAGRQPGGAA